MKQLLAFLILILGAAPALADVAPSPRPPGEMAIGVTLIVLAVVATAGWRTMRRGR